MSVWDEVLGQPAAVDALRAALRADELGHAWLVVGPRGAGHAELAKALATSLNCPEAAAPDDPCGVCSTCDRIARGVHPAFDAFEPEGAFHVVDAVRETWTPEATRSLTEGRRRVLRIVAADRMNEGAQNAFLKMLEEPPGSLVWVLEAEDESALLDTIQSRCRRLDLVPWRQEILEELAARLDIPADQRAALASAALGSPERLRYLADPDVAEARWRHLAIVDRLATEGPGSVVPLAKELNRWAKQRVEPLKQRHKLELGELEESFGVEGGRGWPPGIKQRVTRRHERLERQEHRRALDLLLDDLSSYLRDLLAVRSGAGVTELVNVDHGSALQRDALRLPAAAAVGGLQAVLRCREALERNGNAELQLERVLMTLALELYAAAA